MDTSTDQPARADLVIDDFTATGDAAAWRVFSDRVMGGVSTGSAAVAMVQGRRALRLAGNVSLENNGGFLQVARSLGRDSVVMGDAHVYAGIALSVCGAPGTYFLHLRTDDTRAPWQFYAAPVPVRRDWFDVVLPWSAFVPEALRTPLDVRRLQRLGVVAAGTAFAADIAVGRVALVR